MNKKIKTNKKLSEKELKKAIYKRDYSKRTVSQRFSDVASSVLGSWNYILFQTCFIIIWIVLNLVGWFYSWDVYPFIFLNLTLSVMAAYTAPVILMSQNREADRDRKRAIIDLATDRSSERKIKEVQKTLARLERKIDQIVRIEKEKGKI